MSELIKKYLPGVVIICLFVLFAVVINIQRKNLREKICRHPAYAIGTVTKIAGGSSGAVRIGRWGSSSHSDPIVHISFQEKGTLRETESKGLLSSNTDYEGKRFVVIYDSLNYKNCILLFDFPIRDTTDFVRYMELFKSSPPNLDM
jgi:hypothetical protein